MITPQIRHASSIVEVYRIVEEVCIILAVCITLSIPILFASLLQAVPSLSNFYVVSDILA